jgi:hypothetical protein
MRAVDLPPPVLVEESEHPYPNNVDFRKEIHIKGDIFIFSSHFFSFVFTLWFWMKE